MMKKLITLCIIQLRFCFPLKHVYMQHVAEIWLQKLAKMSLKEILGSSWIPSLCFLQRKVGFLINVPTRSLEGNMYPLPGHGNLKIEFLNTNRIL